MFGASKYIFLYIQKDFVLLFKPVMLFILEFSRSWFCICVLSYRIEIQVKLSFLLLYKLH